VSDLVDISGRPALVTGVLTHELTADRAEEAFRTAQDSEASGKVLVSLWHDDDLGRDGGPTDAATPTAPTGGTA
jgi:hypothetical protein